MARAPMPAARMDANHLFQSRQRYAKRSNRGVGPADDASDATCMLLYVYVPFKTVTAVVDDQRIAGAEEKMQTSADLI